MARVVRRAQNEFAQPRHGKQNAPVRRAGHQKRAAARQKVLIHHHMHALAGRDQRACAAPCGCGVLLAQGVHPHACGVDDAARLNVIFLPCFGIPCPQPCHLAACMAQLRHGAMVHQQSAMRRRRARQRQRQPRVVKLPIPILHAALQALRLRARQAVLHGNRAQPLRTPQTGLARQQVINLQPHAVPGRFPPAVRRHHERQRLRQMGRRRQDVRAFVQRLAHQRHIALRQITHPAMHQLGGA